MPGIENQTGIHLTNSKIQLVELLYEQNRFHVEHIDEAYFVEQINFTGDKEAKQLALLQNAYDEILLRNKVKSEKVSFTLPFDLFLTMQIPYDNTLVYNDLIEEFRWEFSILYPSIASENLAIQYFEIEKNHFITTASALVVGLRRSHLQLLEKFCKKNNLKFLFADNPHFASDKALFLNNPVLHENLVLSIYITDKFLSLTFLYESLPVSYKLFHIPKSSEIPDIIKKEISEQKFFSMNRDMINHAFISGEDISESYINTLSETTGILFTGFNPFEKINFGSNIVNHESLQKKIHTFSAAAGIAFRLG